MYIPVCTVELINGDCPVGWTVKYVAEMSLSAADLKTLIGTSVIPLVTAYAFRQIRLSISD
ncbi:hypothetical protein [Photobacterium gaetbulicola]|uniref:hypothetical protein n=1 Tax=Photobacterium gaetbulicola TaxID=1295392 RepID=UPI000A8A0223|nr:hypothetical protein [Photobacterium gaetbulicola]